MFKTHLIHWQLSTRLCEKKVIFKRFNFQKERFLLQKKGFFWGGEWISFQCQIKGIFTACILK